VTDILHRPWHLSWGRQGDGGAYWIHNCPTRCAHSAKRRHWCQQ